MKITLGLQTVGKFDKVYPIELIPYTRPKYRAILINRNNHSLRSEPYNFASARQRNEFVIDTNEKIDGYFHAEKVE